MSYPSHQPRTFSASERVITAVAGKEDADPARLPPLYETVDPDALDALVDSAGDDLSISFEYNEYGITIRGDGNVEITHQDD